MSCWTAAASRQEVMRWLDIFLIGDTFYTLCYGHSFMSSFTTERRFKLLFPIRLPTNSQ